MFFEILVLVSIMTLSITVLILDAAIKDFKNQFWDALERRAYNYDVKFLREKVDILANKNTVSKEELNELRDKLCRCHKCKCLLEKSDAIAKKETIENPLNGLAKTLFGSDMFFSPIEREYYYCQKCGNESKPEVKTAAKK